MGTELSRTVTPHDEDMTLRMKNNFRPLKFHHIHGDNVKLRKDGTVACRSEGFCKALAFSDRPVAVGEPIYIKFLEISANWSGALRIGFTTYDPEVLKSKLPKYACPDLTSMPGNWAKAIAERMAKKDSVLYYYVDDNGDVHYGIDSEEYGVFFGGINTSSKLWAVIDIYGNTVAVEFINLNSLNLEHVNESHSNHSSLSRIQESQNFCTLPSEKYSPLFFHTFHGKNIFLKEGSVAARKLGSENLAYVFTERSLSLDEHIRLRVLQIDAESNKKFVYGITSCDPSTLNPYDLPDIEDDLLDRPEYWVVESDSNVYKVGDEINYHFSVEGKLTVMKNNEISTELYIDPDQPLWLFFNVTGVISEIRLLSSLHSDANGDIVTRFENMKTSIQSKIENSDLAVPGTSGLQTFNECAVCYEEPVNCALYRCGHMCMCYSCAMKIWKSMPNVQCPICRKVIQDVIKVYK